MSCCSFLSGKMVYNFYVQRTVDDEAECIRSRKTSSLHMSCFFLYNYTNKIAIVSVTIEKALHCCARLVKFLSILQTAVRIEQSDTAMFYSEDKPSS
jgi:hypothetical protein